MAEQSGFVEEARQKIVTRTGLASDTPAGAVTGELAQRGVNQAGESLANLGTTVGKNASNAIDAIVDFAKFQIEYVDKLCFRRAVNGLYKQILLQRSTSAPKWDFWGPFGYTKSELEKKAQGIQPTEIYIFAAEQVFRKKFDAAQQAYAGCINKDKAEEEANPGIPLTTAEVDPSRLIKPFDRRMDRLFVDTNGDVLPKIPFDTATQEASTIGFIMSEKAIAERSTEIGKKAEDFYNSIKQQKEAMRQDDYYIGLSSLVNVYSITKLYGSKGGEFLLDQVNERAWYEIDQTNESTLGFSKNPTTTSIISWGNGDPYGRTPYHFTDFAFCKYWNLIPNNRMITLRRFAAPIYDNMKFPGMDGLNDEGNPSKTGNNDTQQLGNNGNVQSEGTSTAGSDSGSVSGGSGKKVSFPPMATAVTYFGDETGNNISDLLKFTTGLNWDDAEADVWTVSPDQSPDSQAGAGGLFGNLTKYSEMFNIGLGNYNNQAVLNSGQMPPDPYVDGPYENRIIGPVNRIQSVKKRAPGLQFENTLAITFEYSARPIGGVNPKAALLDILSNFLVLGSASAVFWGGQHRFMGQPQKYPFIGGDKGIQQWYRGDPIGWGRTSMKQLAKQAPNAFQAGGDFFKKLLGVFSSGSLTEGGNKALDILSGGAAGNYLKAFAAERSSGQIPYLQGMKALLIGEPVGEWHVTMGNPLNPMAMIGNLILDHIEIEFNDELGPDDFPTELKVVVYLEHGMARDRDSIQSIFNRGMGRIYELPDKFIGSADVETAVDKFTKDNKKYDKGGRNPEWYNVPIGDSRTNYGKWGRAAQKENALGGEVSVWNRSKFSSISGTQNLDLSLGKIDHKSQYRAADWIYERALKG